MCYVTWSEWKGAHNTLTHPNMSTTVLLSNSRSVLAPYTLPKSSHERRLSTSSCPATHSFRFLVSCELYWKAAKGEGKVEVRGLCRWRQFSREVSFVQCVYG